MRRTALILAAGTALTTTAFAAGPPLRVRVVAPPPPELSADEIRDYEQDQMERRHEMEREALRMNQRAEARARGLDDED